MTKTYTANQFEGEFYAAMFSWVQAGKVDPDPRGQWEWLGIFAKAWVTPHPAAIPDFQDDETTYRWKQPRKRTVVIDGVELVAPEVNVPATGVVSYFIGAATGEIYEYRWNGGELDRTLLANGKVFLTREDAQAMSDAQRKQRMGGAS